MSRKTKDWVTSFIKYTNSTESPLLYREWSAMSTIAAALQRKCYLEWGLFEVYPNLFIALVGPSGTGKSVAMKPARDMLRAIGVNVIAQRITPEGLIREMSRGSIDFIDPKSNRVYLHSSVTVHSSELAVFLGYQNRQFISDLCDLYDCDDKWSYKTKDPSLSDEIIGVYLNIIGGITPAILQAVLPREAIGGGLTSRMIAVFEEEKGKIVPIPYLSKEQKELESLLVSDLADINQLSGKFRTTEDFISKYIDWYVDAQKNPPFNQPQFEGYLTRRHLQILKMCMILSASESDSMLITGAHIDRAIDLLNRTERKMARTFAGVGESRTSDVLVNIMAYIGKHKETTVQELHRVFYADADRKTLHEVLMQLEEMRYITVEHGEGGTKIRYKKESGD